MGPDADDTQADHPHTSTELDIGRQPDTLLHFAARRGLRQVALFLLEQPGGRAALRYPNQHGRTPAGEAHKHGHTQLQELLVDQEELCSLSAPHKLSHGHGHIYPGGRGYLRHHPGLDTYTLSQSLPPGSPPPILQREVQDFQRLIQNHRHGEGDTELQQQLEKLYPATGNRDDRLGKGRANGSSRRTPKRKRGKKGQRSSSSTNTTPTHNTTHTAGATNAETQGGADPSPELPETNHVSVAGVGTGLCPNGEPAGETTEGETRVGPSSAGGVEEESSAAPAHVRGTGKQQQQVFDATASPAEQIEEADRHTQKVWDSLTELAPDRQSPPPPPPPPPAPSVVVAAGAEQLKQEERSEKIEEGPTADYTMGHTQSQEQQQQQKEQQQQQRLPEEQQGAAETREGGKENEEGTRYPLAVLASQPPASGTLQRQEAETETDSTATAMQPTLLTAAALNDGHQEELSEWRGISLGSLGSLVDSEQRAEEKEMGEEETTGAGVEIADAPGERTTRGSETELVEESTEKQGEEPTQTAEKGEEVVGELAGQGTDAWENGTQSRGPESPGSQQEADFTASLDEDHLFSIDPSSETDYDCLRTHAQTITNQRDTLSEDRSDQTHTDCSPKKTSSSPVEQLDPTVRLKHEMGLGPDHLPELDDKSEASVPSGECVCGEGSTGMTETLDDDVSSVASNQNTGTESTDSTPNQNADMLTDKQSNHSTGREEPDYATAVAIPVSGMTQELSYAAVVKRCLTPDHEQPEEEEGKGEEEGGREEERKQGLDNEEEKSPVPEKSPLPPATSREVTTQPQPEPGRQIEQDSLTGTDSLTHTEQTSSTGSDSLTHPEQTSSTGSDSLTHPEQTSLAGSDSLTDMEQTSSVGSDSLTHTEQDSLKGLESPTQTQRDTHHTLTVAGTFPDFEPHTPAGAGSVTHMEPGFSAGTESVTHTTSETGRGGGGGEEAEDEEEEEEKEEVQGSSEGEEVAVARQEEMTEMSSGGSSPDAPKALSQGKAPETLTTEIDGTVPETHTVLGKATVPETFTASSEVAHCLTDRTQSKGSKFDTQPGQSEETQAEQRKGTDPVAQPMQIDQRDPTAASPQAQEGGTEAPEAQTDWGLTPDDGCSREEGSREPLSAPQSEGGEIASESQEELRSADEGVDGEGQRSAEHAESSKSLEFGRSSQGTETAALSSLHGQTSPVTSPGPVAPTEQQPALQGSAEGSGEKRTQAATQTVGEVANEDAESLDECVKGIQDSEGESVCRESHTHTLEEDLHPQLPEVASSSIRGRVVAPCPGEVTICGDAHTDGPCLREPEGGEENSHTNLNEIETHASVDETESLTHTSQSKTEIETRTQTSKSETEMCKHTHANDSEAHAHESPFDTDTHTHLISDKMEMNAHISDTGTHTQPISDIMETNKHTRDTDARTHTHLNSNDMETNIITCQSDQPLKECESEPASDRSWDGESRVEPASDRSWDGESRVDLSPDSSVDVVQGPDEVCPNSSSQEVDLESQDTHLSMSSGVETHTPLETNTLSESHLETNNTPGAGVVGSESADSFDGSEKPTLMTNTNEIHRQTEVFYAVDSCPEADLQTSNKECSDPPMCPASERVSVGSDVQTLSMPDGDTSPKADVAALAMDGASAVPSPSPSTEDPPGTPRHCDLVDGLARASWSSSDSWHSTAGTAPTSPISAELEESERKDRVTEVPALSALLRPTMRPLSPFRRHSWGPGKVPTSKPEASESNAAQRNSVPLRSPGGGRAVKTTGHRRSVSWCPSDILRPAVEEIGNRSSSLEGLSAEQEAGGVAPAPGPGVPPTEATRCRDTVRGERGSSLVSLTEEEQEADMGECSSLDSQKSLRLLRGLSRPPHHTLTKSRSLVAISPKDLDGLASFSSTTGSLEYSISEEDPGPLRTDVEGRQGTKVSRTFSYLKSKMSKKSKEKEREKERLREREKDAKEREKGTVNGHLFSAITNAPSTPCQVCSRPLNTKEALICNYCSAHVHKGCRENLPVCAKVKMKQTTVTDSAPLSAVTMRNKTPAVAISRDRPKSTISIPDDQAPSLPPTRKSTSSIMSFSGHLPLSKSVSISNIAGPVLDDMPLRRYLSQSTDSLHKTSKVNESTESLTDEGTEMMDSQLMCEFEPDVRELEADSWSMTVDKKQLKHLKKDVVKRQDVIYELIQTEMHHVRTLRIMGEVYCKGLARELQLEGALLDRLFPCLDDLSELHSCLLSAMLERRRDPTTANACFLVHRIGDVLVSQFSGSNAERMKKVYGKFCSRHNEAVNFYKELYAKDKRFQAFIKKKMSSTIVRRLSIPECILLVTQRITKYPVLIQRILQHTKDGDEEQEDVSRSLRLVKEVLTAVDTRVHDYEKKRRLKEVYGRTDSKSIMRMKSGQMFAREDLLRGRRLLHDGPLQLKTSAGRFKDVQALLLSDVFVFLQEKDQKYVFASLDQRSTVISLQKLIVREVANEEKALFLITAGIEQPEMVEVYASSKEERNTWIQLIQNAMQSIEKDEDEGIPSESEEDKRLQENKAKEMREHLHQKDVQILSLLEDKVKLFRELCDCAAPDDLIHTLRGRMMFRATPNDVTKGEPIMKDALKEVETLQELVNRSVGGAVGHQMSSCQDPPGGSVGPVCLPRRAETFGGFDSHQMHISKNGDKDEGEDLRRTESDSVLKKGGNANLLLLLKRNSEQVLNSVTHLHDLLLALQAVVVQQDSFIEDQRQALLQRSASFSSSSSICSSFSSSPRPGASLTPGASSSGGGGGGGSPGGVAEAGTGTGMSVSVADQERALSEERRRWQAQCEERERTLSEREQRAQHQEDEATTTGHRLEEERRQLRDREDELQRDLQRLQHQQEEVQREREKLREAQGRLEQEKEQLQQHTQEQPCRPHRTPSTTSDDSVKFQSSGSLDRFPVAPADGDLSIYSTSPATGSMAKDLLSRMDSKKRKGKNLNPFSSSSSSSSSSSVSAPQQIPSRLLQLTKPKDKKDKKKKGKGKASAPTDAPSTGATDASADGEVFFC